MVNGERNAVWYDEDSGKVVHYFPHLVNPKLETELL
jgi:hypothetical protein